MRGSETRPTLARTAIADPPAVPRRASLPSARSRSAARASSARGSRPRRRREQRCEVEALAPVGQRGPQIAERCNSRRNVVDAEVVDRRAAFELLPCERRRDGCERCWTRRINRRERTAPSVLVVIDEYATRGPLR